MRPTWDELWVGLAQQVARRSTCDRGQVGAVLVRGNRVLSTGYNGAPKGLPTCDHEGHLMIGGRCARTVHAELNAILNSEVRPEGATMYATHLPCYLCAYAIIQSGVAVVRYVTVYEGAWPSAEVYLMLERAGVQVERIVG